PIAARTVYSTARFRRPAASGRPTPSCRSSVVEHSLGKGEVHSSILCGSTSFHLVVLAGGSRSAEKAGNRNWHANPWQRSNYPAFPSFRILRDNAAENKCLGPRASFFGVFAHRRARPRQRSSIPSLAGAPAPAGRLRRLRREGCRRRCLSPADHAVGVFENVRRACHVAADLDLPGGTSSIAKDRRPGGDEIRPVALIDAQIER